MHRGSARVQSGVQIQGRARRGARVHAVYVARKLTKDVFCQPVPPSSKDSSFCKKKKKRTRSEVASRDNSDDPSFVVSVYLRRSDAHSDMDWDISQNQSSAAAAVRGFRATPTHLLS